MSDLVHIDYEKHEYYAHLPTNDQLRSIAYTRFDNSFGGIWNEEKKLVAKQRGMARLSNKYREGLLSELNSEGITQFSLSADFTRELVGFSEQHIKRLTIEREKKASEHLGVEAASQLLGRIKSDETEYYNEINGELQRLGIFEVASAYLQREVRLKMVIMQKNSDQDKGIRSTCAFGNGDISDCYYMHVDSSVRTLKLILYLTNTSRKNGAFRYTPKSHKWLSPLENCIRRTNDRAGFDGINDEAMTLFRNLPPALQKKANFGNDIIGSQEVLGERLIGLENVFEGRIGDGVLFDNAGVHRGAIFEDRGERVILQLLLI